MPSLAYAASYNTTQSQTTGGITHIESSSDITTINQYGMHAQNSGSVISADDKLLIKTLGVLAHGSYASADSSIKIGDSAKISTSGNYANGVYAEGGSNTTIGRSVDITASGEHAFGVYALVHSSIDIGGSAKISTGGYQAHGVHALTSSDIKIGNSADITASGVEADGVYAYDYSSIDIDDYAKITVEGAEATGVYSGMNSKITVGDSAYITATGAGSIGARAGVNSTLEIGSGATITTTSTGVYAFSGSIIDIGNSVKITTSESNGYGLMTSGNTQRQAEIRVGSGSQITTTGSGATGIFGNNSSKITIGSEGTVTTSGRGAHGAWAYDKGGVEIGAGANITTTNTSAHGLYASYSSNITVSDLATIKTLSNDANAVYAYNNASIDIGNSAKISTSGAGAYGAYAYSSSIVKVGSGSTITTLSNDAVGAMSYNSSDMTIGESAKIATTGKMSYGAYARGRSNIKIGGGATITTLGDSAHGAWAQDNSNIKIGGGSGIGTSGNLAHGAWAYQGSSIDIGANVTISTIGENAHALYADSNASILLAGATISATGDGSQSVYAGSGSQVTGSGLFNITGDMYAAGAAGMGNTSIDLTLENGSTFTGMTSYSSNGASTDLNLTLNGAGTKWILTGDSYLTNLHMKGATVDLTQAFGLNLATVNLGESGSDRGTFIMETSIGNQEADQLIITGVAQGNYVIDVLNSGSDSSTGTELTDLVQVNPGQSAVFVLDHIVESGGFQFLLHAPDVDTLMLSARLLDAELLSGPQIAPMAAHLPNTWYLYSSGQASTAGSGAINSFAGSYLMAYAETNTLMQRMGDLRDSEYLSGLWFRVHGGKFESNAKSYVRGFDMKYGGVQIGYDRKLENKWDGDIYAGVMFGYSKGDLDYSSEGSGNVDSKALGVYGVYVRPDGFYIDASLKYQWMTNDFDVIDTAGTLVRGNDVDTGGLGFSVEVGQRIPFSGTQKSGWYVEPQIQLSYQRQDGGYFNATNGLNIGVEPFTSLLGRVGMLVGYETERTNFYGKVSKAKEFDGDLTIHANGVPIAESFGGSWWVYGLGFTSRVNDRNSLHLDIERTSGGSFSQPWRINAGWRVEF